MSASPLASGQKPHRHVTRTGRRAPTPTLAAEAGTACCAALPSTRTALRRTLGLPRRVANRYARPTGLLRLNDILDRVAGYHPDPDLDLIKKAYVYSAKVHQGQIRKSGEPYLIHPLEVAGILAELKLDEASVVTGLLHDTIEDTLATMDEIAELFGPEIADLVDGVTKLSQFTAANTQEEKQAENFRKMVVAMAQRHPRHAGQARRPHRQHADARAHEARGAGADRARDARHLRAAREPARHPVDQERARGPLVQVPAKPTDYADLSSRSKAERKKEREKYIDEVVELIRTQARRGGLEGEVSGRAKHLYSIWRKMQAQPTWTSSRSTTSSRSA